MNFIKKKIYQLLVVLIVFLISSCREDIIPPNNPASNPNQPVRLISNSSYSFILNANNVSTTYKDYPELTGVHTTVHIFLNDYRKGTAIFHIYNNSEQLIFQKAISDTINVYTENIDNEIPSIVQIIFNDFTGNLKIVVDNW